MKYFDQSGRTAVIVGGATGLGYEMATGFLEAGAKVVLASRNEEKLADSVDRLNAAHKGDRASWLKLDVTDASSRENFVSAFEQNHGDTLDILVQSGGINVRTPLADGNDDDTRSVVETNLLGPMFLTKLLYKHLKNSSAGRVINLASIFASVSYPERSNYAVSKGGILQLTRTLASEWAHENITVNSISPGPFLTEINRKVLDNPENYKDFCRNIPMGRFGNPEEIITTALYLAAPSSSYVTGADIFVDGGWTAT